MKDSVGISEAAIKEITKNSVSRSLSYFIGPESVLIALSLAVFWFCARHNSGEGRDILLLEKLVMTLPLFVVPIAAATVFVPGAKNFLWLGRFVVLTYLMLAICAGRIITGFGTGAKGQDAAFILVIVFGTVMIALATSVTGAMILAETRPAFAAWFRGHKIVASILTLLSAVPIGLVLGVTATVLIGILAAAYSSLKS